MSLIDINNLFFQYKESEPFCIKLDGLSIQKQEHVFLEGPSGCGKTTLLNLITGLCSPQSGTINILDTDIASLPAIKADLFRADHFGIIFQQFNLIPYLSVIENILLSCSFSTQKKQTVLSRANTLEDEAKRLCMALDLENRLLQKPVRHLSIGQQQRVAIARAVIGQPQIIIADEATSALDQARKNQFIRFLLEEISRFQGTLLFVSHDTTLKSHFNTSFNVEDLITGSKDAYAHC